MKIIFLNNYFHPDYHSASSQMLSDLAFALAEKGQKVTVIASRQLYYGPEEKLPAREICRGVDIRRVRTTHFGRRNLVGRAADYATFYLAAAAMLWRLTRNGDVVVAKTDPPMLSVLAAPIARLRGAKLVSWMQDVFPEVAEALGVGRGRCSSLAYGMMRWLRNRSLRYAAMSIAIGDRMAARLTGFGITPDRIRVITNWADGGLVKPVEHAHNALRKAWGLSDNFVVGYSGNLGRAHEYATLLEAIALLEQLRGPPTCITAVAEGSDARDTIWLFVGGGALYEAFRRDVVARQLTTVQFKPYQPRERLAESLSAADVHLVSLRAELEGLIVPSKFYGIAAVARPTLFIGAKNGEIARLLSRHDCGMTVAENDSVGLARAVLALSTDAARCRRLGANARRAFEAEFDKAIAVARWQQLLAELDALPSAAARRSASPRTWL